jgi:hypothetical protein
MSKFFNLILYYLNQAILRGKRSSRSHRRTVVGVAARDFRVRPLGPVRRTTAVARSPDLVGTRLQASFASPPSTIRAAPAFGRPLSRCYGSDLLSLRLPFRLQLGDRVLSDRPKRGGFAGFASPAHSPTTLRCCAPWPLGPSPFDGAFAPSSVGSPCWICSSNRLPSG